MQIIAKATDQTHQHDTSEEGNISSEVKEDDTCLLNESTENDGNLLLPGSFLSECNRLNMEISCINPWGWTQKRTTEQNPLPCESCFAWHPLRHAAMVAIENAAERDRMLFPSLTSLTKPDSNGNLNNCCDNEPAKRLKMDTKDKEQSADEICCTDLSETTRPYLCTGYDIYLVWEPCTMCAMALVHHRFKRVFYAFPNPVTGALGGVYRLHGERSLNHHYSVFRISVPEAYLNSLSV
uniref:CMP/dCMP-type deaminase domain-containing protein n=1 Tax=Arundo donax TaxID=35708 RepID=A0A0A9DVQ9_ARUDO